MDLFVPLSLLTVASFVVGIALGFFWGRDVGGDDARVEAARAARWREGS